MINIIKRFASYLPTRCQQYIKLIHYGLQIRNRKFISYEEEFARLGEWVREGDWVLDIGANIGHYSARLSEIVGSTGRVLCFEPVPQTFELLSANMAKYPYQNITLLNVAVSETTNLIGMSFSRFDTGLTNYYEAHVTKDNTGLSVVSISVDSLNIPKPIKLAKIDVEGHELSVLRGMENLIKRDHPIMIIEGSSTEVASYLKSLGYIFEETPGSPNRVFFKDRSH